MLFYTILSCLLSALALQSSALAIGGRPNQLIKSSKRQLLQDLVSRMPLIANSRLTHLGGHLG